MTDVIPSLRSYLESGGLLTGYIGEEVFDTLADCHAGRFDLPSVRQERFERLTSMFARIEGRDPVAMPQELVWTTELIEAHPDVDLNRMILGAVPDELAETFAVEVDCRRRPFPLEVEESADHVGECDNCGNYIFGKALVVTWRKEWVRLDRDLLYCPACITTAAAALTGEVA